MIKYPPVEYVQDNIDKMIRERIEMRQLPIHREGQVGQEPCLEIVKQLAPRSEMTFEHIIKDGAIIVIKKAAVDGMGVNE